MSNPERMLRTEDVCQITGLKAPVFHKARSVKVGLAADLPYIRLGRRIFYRHADVMEWLEKHLVRPDAN